MKTSLILGLFDTLLAETCDFVPAIQAVQFKNILLYPNSTDKVNIATHESLDLLTYESVGGPFGYQIIVHTVSVGAV